MKGIIFSLFVGGILGTLDTNSEQIAYIPSLNEADLSGEFKDSPSNTSTCDCGENSVSCELKNGVKICECEPGYASGEYQNCAPSCNRTHKCNNGGSCFNDVCLCLPGTRGPYCDVIDGCSELNCGNDKNANCSYHQKNFKAFCACRQKRYEFDYEDNTCKSCDCEKCEIGKFCFSSSRKCEFVHGQKTCTCISPNYKFNPKSGRCEDCSVYGDKVSCDFDQDGSMVLECKEKFKQKGDFCYECDCGWWGSCKLRNYDKVCSCRSGYSDSGGTCRNCDCGDNGKCEFDGWYTKTKCICDPGYYDDSGKCREVKTCYCGENATCKYSEDGVKRCDCPQGYHDINGMCTDVNECENPDTCHSSMTCINEVGGHECVCREGFRVSDKETDKCEDVNECLDPSFCSDAKTQCLNTVGGYKCYCKPGYATRVDEDSSVTCESKSGWKLGYGLLIGVFIVVIGVLMVMVYKYR